MEPFAVVGHVAMDRVVTGDGERRQLGGPPTYVSLITHLLGGGLRVCTKVGGDFPAEYAESLASRGADVGGYVVPSAKTTRFVLDYTAGERRMSVESVCEEIWPEDVRGLPDAVLLAPIIQEIPAETLSVLEAGTIALDPQGFLRRRLPDGLLEHVPWLDEGLIRRLTILKASRRELRLMTGAENTHLGLKRLRGMGVDVCVATLGGEGSQVLWDGGEAAVPAHEGGVVVDPTGAGDAFLAGFFHQFIVDGDIEWSAAVGSAAASAVVETIGPSVEITCSELMERAEEIREGIRRLT
jgi:sugar/nucleoside kinase (ribokinase family)